MSNQDLSVYCLTYAQSVLPESMVFDGGNIKKHIPISFAIYLIQSGHRNILVDAGCDTMPGFDMKNFYSPAFVLRQVGLCADDITDIILTHSHHDHIEAIKHFDKATIHIAASEYENAKAYISDSSFIHVFRNTYRLSPQITVIEWGGHSKGSSIVEIKTEDAIHILAGDECYTQANITKGICTGSFFDEEKAKLFIKKYRHKPYRVHTCHDISLKTEKII